jgi:hypothetical protein
VAVCHDDYDDYDDYDAELPPLLPQGRCSPTATSGSW